MIKINLIAVSVFIICIFYPVLAHASFGEHFYTNGVCADPVLNSNDSKLYISCPDDNLIYEISTETMQVIRSFSLETPCELLISNDDNYLYAVSISQWPVSFISRIRLSDGCIDNVSINGHTTSFTTNVSGSHIWVSHYTYPAPDEYITLDEALRNHNGSAYITNISTSPFSVIQTTPAWALPAAIWYCDYSGDVFNTYEWPACVRNEPDGAAIGVFDGDTLACVGQLPGGCTYGNSLEILMNLCNWTDDSRYAAIPNLYTGTNECSIKVIDTTRTENFNNFKPSFLLTFNHPITGKMMGTEFLKKVPGTDIMWATSDDGNPPEDENRARYVIKINTSTHDYEVFEIPEATSPFGYFDVSADGRILYLTQPEEGSVIKCAPGNNDPICRCRIVTPMPYSGPSPAAIEFDTQGTFDEDGDDLTYHWDFDGDCIYDELVDDSYTGDPDNPTHEYTRSGEYTVNLMVTDNYQGECETSVLVSVRIM